MSEALRFHLDEHIDPRVAEALHARGIDVTVTRDVGLRSGSDMDQLQFASADERVIVSRDADFLRLAAATPDHPGIVFCGSRGLTTSRIIQGLLLIHGVLTPEECAGTSSISDPPHPRQPTLRTSSETPPCS